MIESGTGKKKVLLLCKIDDTGLELLREHFDIIPAEDQKKATALKYAPEISAMITGLTTIDQEVITAAGNLKVIAMHGTGTGTIDVDFATKKGIAVVTTGDANARAVAEHVVIAVGALAKKVRLFDRQMRENNWGIRKQEKTGLLSGKKLGVIGFGNTGKLVCDIAGRGFGMKIAVFARAHHREEIERAGFAFAEDLDQLCHEMDFLTVHLPLTDETRHLIDRRRLSLMKPSACLINYARGGIVDETALSEALRERTIAGAALDVFESEPDPPAADQLLFRLDNVLLSPHVAWGAEEASEEMSMRVAEGVRDVLLGKVPRHCINWTDIHPLDVV